MRVSGSSLPAFSFLSVLDREVPLLGEGTHLRAEISSFLLPSQVGGMPVGQQGTEQGAESQSRVRRSTGEREPEQQASQLGTFPATTVPQAPSDLERNYMVEALQQLGIDVRPLMRPTSRKPYPDWIDRVHQFRGIRCLSLFSFPVRRRSRLLSI